MTFKTILAPGAPWHPPPEPKPAKVPKAKQTNQPRQKGITRVGARKAQIIERIASGGLTDEQIAAEFGLTGARIGQIRREAFGNSKEIRMHDAIALFKAGKTIEEVQAATGLRRRRVVAIRRQVLGPLRLTAAERQQQLQARKQQHALEVLAEGFDPFKKFREQIQKAREKSPM